MEPAKSRAPVRTAAVGEVVEAAFDVIVIAALLAAIISVSSATAKIMAAAAIALIVIGWVVGRRRFPWRK